MTSYCQACGRRLRRATEAKQAAEDARELILRLAKRYGSIRATAAAVAERHGHKPEVVRKRFQRLLAGQKTLWNDTLVDELQVLL